LPIRLKNRLFGLDDGMRSNIDLWLLVGFDRLTWLGCCDGGKMGWMWPVRRKMSDGLDRFVFAIAVYSTRMPYRLKVINRLRRIWTIIPVESAAENDQLKRKDEGDEQPLTLL
jgi:hypothetical protein